MERIVIDVTNGRAHVARWAEAPGGGLTLERARNWLRLEAEAAASIEDAGVAPVECTSGQYDCPAALAARATWPHSAPSDPGTLTIGRVADILGYPESVTRGLLLVVDHNIDCLQRTRTNLSSRRSWSP